MGGDIRWFIHSTPFPLSFFTLFYTVPEEQKGLRSFFDTHLSVNAYILPSLVDRDDI